MIKKLLIANRGEIAVRIIRSAREMGISTVAVYSEADAQSMHVALADEAVPIGASEPSASYLSIERILEAAMITGADAIHPGYGFLSERAEFSDACQAAGIVFVGPPAEAMRKLGAKIESKQLAVAARVPVTPGFFEPGATKDDLRSASHEIGYPVMLKASAGGGGRGMRVVRAEEDFNGAFDLASEEALKAFGDGAMMVEKFVENPRHIEVQFLADQHGKVACLFERECSIQRRHQKLIEEAPSPVMLADPSGWPGLKASVENLVRAAGYVGAGTAEFIYSEADRSFYFLEVNARLQVEHPVTEAITGLDLVQWQLRIADGEELRIDDRLLAGERSAIIGHALEVRIIAEDPGRGFLPSVGKILGWAEPKAPGVRVDTGFNAGSEVSRFYDSMLAKVIVHAETRADAIAKMRRALMDFHVLGVKTNIAYILEVLGHQDFCDGKFDTGFLDRYFAEWHAPVEFPKELAALLSHAQSANSGSSARAKLVGAWDRCDRFRLHKYT